MRYAPEIRAVKDDGDLGPILASARNISYLDSDADVGSVSFEYPADGINNDQLYILRECALIVDGKELKNGRFRVDESSGNTVSDDGNVETWSGLTLLGRLDEALVMPEDDIAQEDVLTDEERAELKAKRQEWLSNQIEKRKKEAHKKADEAWEEDKLDGFSTDDEGHSGQTHGGAHNDKNPPGSISKRRRKAMRWAERQISDRSQSWDHMCQSFVRQSFGLPGIYGTANEAWHAGRKRPDTPFSDIPPGVPVYWGPNHVALSVGNGRCISTDVERRGWPDFCMIEYLSNGVIWNLDYRGWSPDCSGREIFP
jgi:cell wall-associated NlpC family hydrolase